MPVWNAATRSGEGSFGGARSVFAIAAALLFREFERAGIDLAARPARQFDGVRYRVLDAVMRELVAQEIVERVARQCLRIRRWRPDHQYELAARLQRSGLPCE